MLNGYLRHRLPGETFQKFTLPPRPEHAAGHLLE